MRKRRGRNFIWSLSAWECRLKILVTAQRIVEYYYGSVACVSLYNIQHLVGIEFGIVVTCYHIVEYNVIIIFHVTVSPSAQNSVWRTEQAGGEITVTFLYVINIIVVTHAHSANMIESVVAYVMSAFLYHFIDVLSNSLQNT